MVSCSAWWGLPHALRAARMMETYDTMLVGRAVG